MGCIDGVIENNWVRSANSHPPWPGTVRSNWTLALIISMGCYLSVIDNHWFWSANSPLPHSSSWSLCFLCSLWSTRQLSLTVQDMGCYLNVTENHSLGSANSPPPFWSSMLFDICRLFHHSLDHSEIQGSFMYWWGRGKDYITWVTLPISYLLYSFIFSQQQISHFRELGKSLGHHQVKVVCLLICSSTGPSGPNVRFISILNML